MTKSRLALVAVLFLFAVGCLTGCGKDELSRGNAGKMLEKSLLPLSILLQENANNMFDWQTTYDKNETLEPTDKNVRALVEAGYLTVVSRIFGGLRVKVEEKGKEYLLRSRVSNSFSYLPVAKATRVLVKEIRPNPGMNTCEVFYEAEYELTPVGKSYLPDQKFRRFGQTTFNLTKDGWKPNSSQIGQYS